MPGGVQFFLGGGSDSAQSTVADILSQQGLVCHDLVMSLDLSQNGGAPHHVSTYDCKLLPFASMPIQTRTECFGLAGM